MGSVAYDFSGKRPKLLNLTAEFDGGFVHGAQMLSDTSDR